MYALDWRSLPPRAPDASGSVVALSASASSAGSSAAAYASAGHDGLTDSEWDEPEAPPRPVPRAGVPPCPPQTPAAPPALEHKAEPGGAAEKPDRKPLSTEAP